MLNLIKGSLSLTNRAVLHPIVLQHYRKYSSAVINPSESTIFSGIQPTGPVHLGNYFGAISKWVSLQNAGCKSIYGIMDLHAITLDKDHSSLYDRSLECAATLIACGIDPDKSILFLQSAVPQHLQLYWILQCKSTMAELSDLCHFKENSPLLAKKSPPLGLFIYSLLQAADILLYKATHVPIGKDQLSNIHFTVAIAERVNNIFKDTFVIPKAITRRDDFASIKNLKNALIKMSKSEAQATYICIKDSPGDIRTKIKGCVTDIPSALYYDALNRPGLSNLISIHAAVTKKSYDTIEKELENLNKKTYKELVSTALIEYMSPIQNKLFDLLKNKDYIEDILKKGNQKATELAALTYSEVKVKVGFS